MHASKRQIIITVAIVIIIAAAGFTLGYSIPGLLQGSKTYYLEMVRTEVVSGKNGESHSLEARFLVELDRSMDGSVDLSALQNRVVEVVSGLDYDILSAKDGTLYIKDQIRKNINDFVPEDKIDGIYITDIISDFYLESDPVDSRDGMFKALFPSLR